MVIERDPPLTTSDTTLSCNPSSVNLEGGSSYVHLDDYIKWNPSRVIPLVFPLMFWTHGYPEFTSDHYLSRVGPEGYPLVDVKVRRARSAPASFPLGTVG